MYEASGPYSIPLGGSQQIGMKEDCIILVCTSRLFDTQVNIIFWVHTVEPPIKNMLKEGKSLNKG